MNRETHRRALRAGAVLAVALPLTAGCGSEPDSLANASSPAIPHDSALDSGPPSPTPPSSSSTAVAPLPEEPSAEAFAEALIASWQDTDASVWRDIDQLLNHSSVVIVGRLGERSILPGRDEYVGSGEDEELLYSTYRMRLEVERNLRDDEAHPVERELVVELVLPDSVFGATYDVDDIAATVPVGHAMLVAVAAHPATGRFHPYLQGVVIEDVNDTYVSIVPSIEGVFADRAARTIDSFSGVVEHVRRAINR